jgi:hypothetical protein
MGTGSGSLQSDPGYGSSIGTGGTGNIGGTAGSSGTLSDDPARNRGNY